MKLIILIISLIAIILLATYFIFNYLKNIKKYRIISHTFTLDLFKKEQITYIIYIPQRKFLGFLWWYNLVDSLTGWYYTLEEAQARIKFEMSKHNKK